MPGALMPIKSLLSRLLQSGHGWSRHSVNSFRLNLEEFLQEETRYLPSKPEAELFFQEIDACCGDYDRLKARIERLTTALSNISEPQNRPGSSL